MVQVRSLFSGLVTSHVNVVISFTSMVAGPVKLVIMGAAGLVTAISSEALSVWSSSSVTVRVAVYSPDVPYVSSCSVLLQSSSVMGSASPPGFRVQVRSLLLGLLISHVSVIAWLVSAVSGAVKLVMLGATGSSGSGSSVGITHVTAFS